MPTSSPTPAPLPPARLRAPPSRTSQPQAEAASAGAPATPAAGAKGTAEAPNKKAGGDDDDNHYAETIKVLQAAVASGKALDKMLDNVAGSLVCVVASGL